MNKVTAYDRLSDLYKAEGVGNEFEQRSNFTVHKLEVAHPEPVDSPIFRANYYSFVLIAEGYSSYTIDGIQFKTRPKTLYFTNPGHLKSFSLKKKTKGFLITVTESYLKKHIHTDIFEEFSFLLTESVPPCFLDTAQFDELAALAEQLLAEHQKTSPLTDKILSSYFMVFLLKVKTLLLLDDEFKTAFSRESEIVNRFQKDLEANFRSLAAGSASRLLQVQEFAEKQQLHPNYFSTVISSKTAMTAHGLIQRKLLAEAEALLLGSSMSVKQIAYRLGYNDATNFSKFFKKHRSLSPALYRKTGPS